MSLKSSSSFSSPPWSAIFFALLGLIWCGYVSFPSSGNTPCPTSGCSITKDFSIAGISLWWIGGAYFFFLSILCLRNMRYLAWRLSQIALILDCLFLLLMFITGPCSDCLIIAFFFAMTSYCLRPCPQGWFQGDKPSYFLILPIWFGLFIANSTLALNEQIPPLTMGTQANSSVRLYFAPSCPACRDALAVFGSQATLLPVQEKEEDFAAIITMRRHLALGISLEESLQKALDNPLKNSNISLQERLFFIFGLLRNKSNVFKHGFTHMPLIEINGMPRDLIKTNEDAPNDYGASSSRNRATPQQDSPPDFLDMNKLSQCGQETDCNDESN